MIWKGTFKINNKYNIKLKCVIVITVSHPVAVAIALIPVVAPYPNVF
jgi:hypothetical protein